MEFAGYEVSRHDAEPPTGHPIERCYERPGTMDITASVDLTQLAVRGLSLGLKTISHTTQAQFLQKYDFTVERDEIMRREADVRGVVSSEAHYFGSYVLLALEQMGGHEVMIQQKQ